MIRHKLDQVDRLLAEAWVETLDPCIQERCIRDRCIWDRCIQDRCIRERCAPGAVHVEVIVDLGPIHLRIRGTPGPSCCRLGPSPI